MSIAFRHSHLKINTLRSTFKQHISTTAFFNASTDKKTNLQAATTLKKNSQEPYYQPYQNPNRKKSQEKNQFGSEQTFPIQTFFLVGLFADFFD